MLQKISKFFTLITSAFTFIILLVFLGQQPDYDILVKHDEMTKSFQSFEKDIDKKLSGVENVNGIDALNEKYNELLNENDALRTELDTLKKKLNETPLQTKIKPKAKKPIVEQPKEEPEVLKNETVTVITDNLNFRHDASLSAPIQEILLKSTELEVLEKTVIEKEGYKWVKVGLQNGDIGYIAREYVN